MTAGTFNRVVDVDRVDDTHTGARRGMAPTWTRVATGLRCSITEASATQQIQFQALGARVTHKVGYPTGPKADDGTRLWLGPTHRLVWTDDEGQTRYLKVQGVTKAPGPGIPNYARCQEMVEGAD